MIVVDVLLACNLVVFIVCAVRAPRQARPQLDDLVAAARVAAAAAVPAGGPGYATVIPFRSREQLHLAHAKAIHPSSG